MSILCVFVPLCVHLFHVQMPSQGQKNEKKSFTARTLCLSAPLRQVVLLTDFEQRLEIKL